MARSDFKVVTHPEHQPAVDFITRSGEGPFIDTGVDIWVRMRPDQPFVREHVYLSVATVSQLAQLIGLEGVAQAVAVHEATLIARGKVEGLKENLGGRIMDLAVDLRAVLGAADLGSTPVDGC